MSSDEDFSIRKESQYDDNFSILSTSPPRNFGKSRRTTNTGPKGVRADARAYEASKREANALKSLKNSNLLSAPAASLGESGSEASEDEWMSRWREKRMKELSKTGVAGVNLFGQVDDVDARGYLAAVDIDEDLDAQDDNTPAANRNRARRNVITVVLIYDNVVPFLVVANYRLRIQRICFNCFQNLRDGIPRFTFYDYLHSMLRICQKQHFLQF
jgi:hypothetical protein